MWKELLAAVVIAAAGAISGAVATGRKGRKERKELEERVVREKIRTQKMWDDFTNKLNDHFLEKRNFEKFLVAMFAVGVSVANADGEIVEDEKQEIEEFIAGLLSTALPQPVKEIIQQLYCKAQKCHPAVTLTLARC